MRTPDQLAALLLEERLLLAEVRLAEVTQGWTLADATRDLFPWERAAAVRFAALDRQVEDTAARLARSASAMQDAVLEYLGALALTDPEGNPADALEQLRQLADPSSGATIPGVPELLDDLTDELAADLERTARDAAAEVLEEARRQGLDVTVDRVDLDDTARRQLRTTARRVAEQPLTRTLTLAVDAADRAVGTGAPDAASVLYGALEAVEDSSPAPLTDVARQASSTAQGLGRNAGAAAAPRPSAVYASELMDRATCGPCSRVDGRRYRTLEDALADYPMAGGHIFCEGGLRCRGTLVYVWPTEAPPTIDGTTPPEGPIDPPPDRTPQLPPDDRTSFPRPAPMPPVPPAPPETPYVTDPGPTEPDPELTALTDERLDAEARALAADGNTAGAARYLDELDRRAAGTSRYVDPDAEAWDAVGADLTADDVRRIDDAYAAAMEEAGNVEAILDAVAPRTAGQPRGRRIDRVREAYVEDLYRRSLEAEAVVGTGVRADRFAEYLEKYGDQGAALGPLWEGPAADAYYYASEELRTWWETHPRESFAEYALRHGITDRKTQQRALAAQEAREKAARRSEERGSARDLERRKERAREANRRRDNSAGAQLRRQQERAQRLERRAAELQRRADQ